MIEPHRHDGVFVARGKEDALVTLNFVPGSEVYGEKRISVEVNIFFVALFHWLTCKMMNCVGDRLKKMTLKKQNHLTCGGLFTNQSKCDSC